MAEPVLAEKMAAMTGKGVIYAIICPRCQKRLDGISTPKDVAEHSGTVKICVGCGQELEIP